MYPDRPENPKLEPAYCYDCERELEYGEEQYDMGCGCWLCEPCACARWEAHEGRLWSQHDGTFANNQPPKETPDEKQRTRRVP